MKKFTILLLLIAIFTSCSTSKDDPIPDLTPEEIASGHKIGTLIKKISGEWKAENSGAGGFEYPESFKNYQFDYEVDADNQLITYSAQSSDIDINIFLYEANGTRLWQSGKGRNVKGERTLNAGKYRIVVMADRNAVGKFELKIGNITKEIAPVSFEILKSGETSWGVNGGGGNSLTPKNHFYTFEVTEDNTVVDVEMESKDTNIILALYNTNGELIKGEVLQRRRHFILAKLNKGIFQVMAATGARGARGNYTLSVFGKTKALLKRPIAEKLFEGNMAKTNDIKTFTIEVTQNSSVIDLQLNTIGMVSAVYLYDNAGELIEKAPAGGYLNSATLIARVQKGTYKVYIEPFPYGQSISTNFKLLAVGEIK